MLCFLCFPFLKDKGNISITQSLLFFRQYRYLLSNSSKTKMSPIFSNVASKHECSSVSSQRIVQLLILYPVDVCKAKEFSFRMITRTSFTSRVSTCRMLPIIRDNIFNQTNHTKLSICFLLHQRKKCVLDNRK